MSHLDFLYGLHMDTAVPAALHEGRVEGVHQDDSLQARSLLSLHIVQKHLSFLYFVADDRGDVSWNDTSTQEHTHPCVIISRIGNKQKKETRQKKKKDPDVGWGIQLKFDKICRSCCCDVMTIFSSDINSVHF